MAQIAGPFSVIPGRPVGVSASSPIHPQPIGLVFPRPGMYGPLDRLGSRPPGREPCEPPDAGQGPSPHPRPPGVLAGGPMHPHPGQQGFGPGGPWTPRPQPGAQLQARRPHSWPVRQCRRTGAYILSERSGVRGDALGFSSVRGIYTQLEGISVTWAVLGRHMSVPSVWSLGMARPSPNLG